MVKYINTEQLKRLAGGDGLILQGCGGNPNEWLKGINEAFTAVGILKNGGEFKDIYVFSHDGVTNILYPFESMTPETLDMGKLATWRLQNYESFNGIWHSDYIVNKLGVSLENQDESFDRPDERVYPITIDIGNAFDPSLYSFSISLPILPEQIKPFLGGAEIIDWRDMAIHNIESNINGLGDRLSAIIDNNGMNPDTLDELNFLAVKIETVAERGEYGGIEIFSANIEAGLHCKTIAEIINLTFDENLYRFDIFPVFNEDDYGDILVNQFRVDDFAETFNRLKNSTDEEERKFAAHIEMLERHVDTAAFGAEVVKEEGGIFTEYGYLIDADSLRPMYQGPQDIPDEHRVLSPSARDVDRIMKIDDVNIVETIVKLHAVGCRSMEYAPQNITGFLADHKQLAENEVGNPFSNHYILMLNHNNIRITPAMDVYMRGSEMNKLVLGMTELAVKNENRADIRIFAVRINNAHSVDAEQGGRDLRGDMIELSPYAFNNHITRYAAPPDKTQLETAANRFGNFMSNHEMMSEGGTFDTHLLKINASYIIPLNGINNHQPGMISVTNEAAREILARGDADVYRFMEGNYVKLNTIEAFRSICFSEYNNLAIKKEDAGGLDKWAAFKVKDMVREIERAEHSKVINKGEEAL